MMPSPFPGMDPYLENPLGWENIHTWLLMGIAEVLAPALRPNYVVSVQERVYVSAPDELVQVGPRRLLAPDVSVADTGMAAQVERGSLATLTRPIEVLVPLPATIRQGYLEIRDLRTDREVVTVLEVLSPTNKQPGKGRKKYLRKREALLDSSVNLVEIDLLRSGPRLPVLHAPPSYDYSILVSREVTRAAADFYSFGVRDSFPIFRSPLRPGELEPVISLNGVLSTAYDRGAFDLIANYKEAADPPLSPEDMVWAEALLQEKGIR